MRTRKATATEVPATLNTESVSTTRNTTTSLATVTWAGSDLLVPRRTVVNRYRSVRTIPLVSAVVTTIIASVLKGWREIAVRLTRMTVMEILVWGFRKYNKIMTYKQF